MAICLLLSERAMSSTLKPCEWTLLPYLDAIETASYEGLPGHRLLTAVVQPSFQPGWGISVYRQASRVYLVRVQLNNGAVIERMTRDGPVYELRSTGSSEAPVGHGVAITNELYGLLDVEWRRLLDDAVTPSRPKVGVDGTSYIFRSSSGGCGGLRSPHKGYEARLVNILSALADAAQGPANSRPLDSERVLQAVCKREVATGETSDLRQCLALGLFPSVREHEGSAP